ncbi:MAG: CoA-binding protein [Candidatus Peribacteria bacterium]|jgi:predicted CoA-binding protein|nr:CoA-binding protein [Candidatus Peribacteria bacterium]
MISKSFIYALVGASNAPEKFGNKIFLDLTEAGYKIIPINLKETEIAGIKAYPNLSSVKTQIDVIIFVVPPQITLEVLKEVKKMNIKNIWMQPGSESDEAIAFCAEHNINCIHNACMMIERRNGHVSTNLYS